MARFIRFAVPAATVVTTILVLAGPAWACMDSKLTAADQIQDHPEHAAALLPKINAERATAGLAPMVIDAGASAIANDFARQLAANGTLWHNDAYFTSSVRASLHALALGENVACNWSLDAAHAALMASPGHRANILDPRFTAVGLAVVSRPDGALYIAEDFLQPSGIIAATTSTPPAAAQVKTASAAPEADVTATTATTATSPTAGPATTAAPPVATTSEVALAAAPVSSTSHQAEGVNPLVIGTMAALLLVAAGVVVRRVRTR